MEKEAIRQLLLLLEAVHGASDGSSDSFEDVLQLKALPARLWAMVTLWELKNLWCLSGASITISVFNFMLSLATQIFVGQLSALQLARDSIAIVGIQGLAYGIMLGMARVVQTVSGQAYEAKKFSSLGIIFQKAIVLHLGAALLLSFIYWYSSSILQAIGQSTEVPPGT